MSDEPLARSRGRYFYHWALREPDPLTRDEACQDALLDACARLTGVPFPR